MVGWSKITIHTKGWDENKDIICNTIKPLVEKLEKTGDIVNFFFLEYYGDNKPARVTLTFYGDDKTVLNEIKTCGNKTEIEKWDPAKQNYRFEDDYPLGIKIFELGSRLALCSIDDKLPIDKSCGPRLRLCPKIR